MYISILRALGWAQKFTVSQCSSGDIQELGPLQPKSPMYLLKRPKPQDCGVDDFKVT
jgi:hypothetical protein